MRNVMGGWSDTFFPVTHRLKRSHDSAKSAFLFMSVPEKRLWIIESVISALLNKYFRGFCFCPTGALNNTKICTGQPLSPCQSIHLSFREEKRKKNNEFSVFFASVDERFVFPTSYTLSWGWYQSMIIENLDWIQSTDRHLAPWFIFVQCERRHQHIPKNQNKD